MTNYKEGGWSKVDEYARIRRAHVADGMNIKALARQFHHSRRKIREILGTSEPKSYVRLNPPPSILDPFKPIIAWDLLLTREKRADTVGVGAAGGYLTETAVPSAVA